MNKIKYNNQEINSKVSFLNKRAFIVVLLLIITVLSGTFAWYSYSSARSKLVLTIADMNNAVMQITPYNIKKTIVPVNTYLSGVSSDVKIVNNNSDSIDFSLYYTVNNMQDQKSLKYTVTQSSTSNGTYSVVSTGDFSNVINNVVNVIDNVVDADTTVYYRVYVWLDSSVEDQTDLQNLSIDIELNGAISERPEKPILDPSMVPVTIDNKGNVMTVSENDTDWYNYSNKEWANVVLVNENATDGVSGSHSRNYYLSNLSNNVPVAEEDILAYYVWIPRYKYRIPSIVDKVTMCGELEDPTKEKYPECYTYGMSDEDKAKFEAYLSATYGCSPGLENSIEDILTTGFIEITSEDPVGLASEVSYYNSLEDGEHCNCDCFTKDGDITLTGGTGTLVSDRIYELKQSTTPGTINIAFESSTDTMVKGDAISTYYSHPAFWFDDNENGIVDTGETLAGIWVGKFEMQVLDDVSSEKILPGLIHFYESTRYYYSDIALDESKTMNSVGNTYGLSSDAIDSHAAKNSEWGAIAYLTHSKYGINSNIENNDTYITGGGTYGTLNVYPQSTTGNINGIFDMSGGVGEWVMAAVEGSDNPLISDDNYNYYKDYNLYTSSDLSTACDGGICYGHALSETNGWYNSYSILDLGEGNSGNVRSLLRDDLFQITPEVTEGPAWASWHSVLINKEKQSILIFDSNINDSEENFVGSTIATMGETITLSTTEPTREGYEFLGWTNDLNNFSTIYQSGDSFVLNDSINVLYAVWGSESYTISYDCNGIECTGLPASQTKNHGESLILSSDVPSATNYTFVGWSVIEGATSSMYGAGDEFTINADKTLYAVWETYLITMYVAENVYSVLNCRSTPVSGTVTSNYACGTVITGYESSTSGWFYYPDGNCYLSSDFLQSTVPSCSSGDSGSSGSTSISGVCKCLIYDAGDSATDDGLREAGYSCADNNLSSYSECQDYCETTYFGFVSSTCSVS